MFYQVTIDETNRDVLTRLNYFLLREKAYTATHDQFILDEVLFFDRVSRKRLDGAVVDPTSSNRPIRTLLYPLKTTTVSYDNSPIEIVYHTSREQPECSKGRPMRFDQMTLRSEHSLQHLTRFLEMISDLQIPMCEDGRLNLFIWCEDASAWLYSRVFTPRQLDTIYFHQKTEIVHLLDQFIHDSTQHNLYRDLNIPCKFICMFHGLPGTGKTSLIRALASHFGYHLCMVKHSQKMDDNSLENMLTRIKDKAFLVFEDIDSIFQAREVRSANFVSYSGILNMLDGIGNYDKLIVFITTNRLQQLDAAFKRRVDLFVEFGSVRKVEVLEMFRRFFSDAEQETAMHFWEQIRSKSLTTNMLEKYFMYCLRKQISPLDDLEYLDDYATQTQEKAPPSSLYQ